VILGCDADTIAFMVLDRMISSVMTKFQLIGASPSPRI
jgi:hypothetical protein